MSIVGDFFEEELPSPKSHVWKTLPEEVLVSVTDSGAHPRPSSKAKAAAGLGWTITSRVASAVQPVRGASVEKVTA